MKDIDSENAKIITAFEGVLYADITDSYRDIGARPLLAHYTSIETLESILKTEKIWFSNPLYMNDLEELKFGILESYKRVIESKVIKDVCGPARHEKFIKSFNVYYNDFVNKHALDVYAFCLSEHEESDKDGLLSMWRGYGGNGKGVAIVFDAKQFGESAQTPVLIISPVKYLDYENRIGWIENIIITFSNFLKYSNLPDDKLYLTAYTLFHRIKIFSLFTKHSGFKEEREWRIIYSKDMDFEEALVGMLDYKIGPNGIEPKLILPIKPIEKISSEDLSIDKILHKIILGPSISSPLSIATVARMLEKINKPQLKEKLIASKIPYRG